MAKAKGHLMTRCLALAAPRYSKPNSQASLRVPPALRARLAAKTSPARVSMLALREHEVRMHVQAMLAEGFNPKQVYRVAVRRVERAHAREGDSSDESQGTDLGAHPSDPT